MEEKKVDRRIRKTQKLLKKGLCDLMKKKPLKNITIKDITDDVDLNRSTFYLHYTDIEDLLEKTEDDFLEGLDIAFEEFEEVFASIDDFFNPRKDSFEKFIKKALEATFEYLEENFDLSYVLFNHNDSAFNEKFMTIVLEGSFTMQKKVFSNVDEKLLSYASTFTTYGTIGLIRNWVNSSPRVDYRELVEVLAKLLYTGFYIYED